MSVYLKKLFLPGDRQERNWLEQQDPTCKAHLKGVYPSFYPFRLFTKYATPPRFSFEPITILYGGNGSGKSTILNVLAKILYLKRNSAFEETDFFEDYCRLCRIEYEEPHPLENKIITSDDVFKKMNASREINRMIDQERNGQWDRKREMKTEILHRDRDDPNNVYQLHGLEDFKRWSEYYDSMKSSTSEFILKRSRKNLESASNGETALKILTEEISENALYLLDEPENSLSPKYQLELKKFIEESSRFFGCQFVISSHSPLILSMKDALIYDLDHGCQTVPWYDLENVRIYAEFFGKNRERFENPPKSLQRQVPIPAETEKKKLSGGAYSKRLKGFSRDTLMLISRINSSSREKALKMHDITTDPDLKEQEIVKRLSELLEEADI